MSSCHTQTICPAVHRQAAPGFAPRAGLLSSLGRIALRVLDGLATWQQRSSERAHLAALDEHHLKDIGLDRADVAREAAKPFWRA